MDAQTEILHELRKLNETMDLVQKATWETFRYVQRIEAKYYEKEYEEEARWLRCQIEVEG